MSTIENNSLSNDVRESIRTQSIVRVDATGCHITDIVSQLRGMMIETDDVDRARENDGTWDVWGTLCGDAFRLRVTCNA